MEFERLLDHGPDTVQVLQHIGVPEADETEPLAFQVGSASGIALRALLTAVHFNDQTLLGTEKVDDVTVDLGLLPEFEAVELPAAQDAPEFPCGIGGVLAERSRSAGQEMVPCHFAPSPRRCAPTLSRDGERVTSELPQIHA